MKRSSRPARTPADLSDSTRQRLNMYALAASAAGVGSFDKNLIGCGAALTAVGLGMLVSALPAEAKIVYTPANITIPSYIPVPLDLNHDGVNDLSFTWVSWGHGKAITVLPQLNGVIGYTNKFRAFASALKGGVRVGPKEKFVNGKDVGMYAGSSPGSGGNSTSGPWHNVQNRYLGVKFSIKGKTHYGWVRANVSENQPGIIAVITGYAYETIPNKPIITGKKKGPEEIESGCNLRNPASVTAPTTKPATLGALAMGAPGLSIWRRKELPGVPR